MLDHVRSASAAGGTASVWSHVRCCKERYRNVLWTGSDENEDKQHARGDTTSSHCPAATAAAATTTPSAKTIPTVMATTSTQMHPVDGVAVGDPSPTGGPTANGGCSFERRGRNGDGGRVGEGRGTNAMARVTRRRVGVRNWRSGFPFPQRLSPACGVRSLDVWHRAYSSRGLEVSAVRTDHRRFEKANPRFLRPGCSIERNKSATGQNGLHV